MGGENSGPVPACGNGTLIVGASQAGVQLAASLRGFGYAAPITLVGSEPHPPYQRPPLSKEYLAGSVEPEGLTFRAESFYADAGIDLVCGERIATLELGPGGASGRAVAESGRVFSFDRLALTVGGQPRRLDVPGGDLEGICYLRKLDDAASFRRLLAPSRRLVVVGGGFIGLETAAAARESGKDVTVVEATDRLIGRVVAPVVSEFYRRAHVRRGVDVMLSTMVTGFRGRDGRISGVELSDGRLLDADLVVVGVGLLPHTRLAEGLGLKCAGGIVVDQFARTSNPAIVAAGDCTVMPHPLTGTGQVHIESVQNAIAQARTAAATLAGRLQDSRAVPWFWSNQGDLKLEIAGLSGGYDQTVVRGDPGRESFSVLYYRDGSLIAVDAVNASRDYLAVRKALGDGSTIPPEAAATRTDVPLKQLIEPATSAVSA